MPVTVRSTENDAEWLEQWLVVAAAFGEPPEAPKPADQERMLRYIDSQYSLVAVEDNSIIGGTVGVSFDLVLPGGARVPANGVAGVGVAPHRTGRGAMRGMLEETLRRASTAGAAASLLMASESPLYGRFGYGCAFSMGMHKLNVDRAVLARPVDDPGSIDLLIDREEARPIMVAAYNSIIDSLPGQLSRNDVWWETVLSDEDGWVGPAKPFVAVHRNTSGTIDGYALYTIRAWEGDFALSHNTLVLNELVTVDAEVELALWSYLLNVPLVRHIEWRLAPVEPRLRHWLTDRRQLQTTGVMDMMWLRPIDVPRLFADRSYLVEGSVRFSVVDELFPENQGPWELTSAGGTGVLKPVESAPIELTAAQVGMVVLGGTSVLELADAGMIKGDQADLISLDGLLRTSVLPFAVSKF